METAVCNREGNVLSLLPVGINSTPRGFPQRLPRAQQDLRAGSKGMSGGRGPQGKEDQRIRESFRLGKASEIPECSREPSPAQPALPVCLRVSWGLREGRTPHSVQ